MIENLKRYTMVIRRDFEGNAIPALKIRQKGDVCKFSELEEALRSTLTNKAMTAIKAICERTDPNEPDASVLRSAMNQIYATLTAS